jgi:cobalamin 5'-phosphate synthase/cobalamin synthase
VKTLPTAVAFLTRIPVPVSWTGGAEIVGKSARFFPLVGVLIGALPWLIWLGLGERLPPLVLAALIVAAEAWVTGALHLDGLADFSDGFGGGHARDDVLRIMRDHLIGAYGATVLILDILLKTAAIAALIERHQAGPWLLLAPGIARWATVALSYLGPYARASGTGAVSNYVTTMELVIASAFAAAFAACLRLPGAGAAGVVLFLSWFFLRWSRRRIGGVTGDVIGACTEVSQTFILVSALLWNK